jgi:hypothetical protein
MKQFVCICMFLLFGLSANSQNYVGMGKTDIQKHMRKVNPGFDLDEGVINNTYKYLKFVDKYNEETWLFFLSDKDICTHSKLMSDYSNLDMRTKDLNKRYKKTGELTWKYIDKGISYTVELVKEEWYFTIVTKKKK